MKENKVLKAQNTVRKRKKSINIRRTTGMLQDVSHKVGLPDLHYI